MKDRKPKSYYVDYSKKTYKDRHSSKNAASIGSRFKSTPDLSTGSQGFLITAIDEVKCYLEMRGILEEYFEVLHKDHESESSNVHETSQEQRDKQLAEDELDNELKQLRKKRPFKQVKTYCRNSLFINIVKEFEYVDPVNIVDKFFDDMAVKGESRTSNTLKVLPILDTFRNNKNCLEASVEDIIISRFKDQEDKKYFIEFQSRGNYKLNPEDKKSMIEVVADVVTKKKPSWTVSRDLADYMIIIVAFRNIGCVSIVEKYFQRKKYNIIEFVKPPEHPDDELEPTLDDSIADLSISNKNQIEDRPSDEDESD